MATAVTAGPDAIILADARCLLCVASILILFRRAPGRASARRVSKTVYVARVEEVGYIVRDPASAPSPVVSDEAETRARDRLFIQKDGGPLRWVNRQWLGKWASLELWVCLEGDGERKTFDPTWERCIPPCRPHYSRARIA